jgi:hypothetical protein
LLREEALVTVSRLASTEDRRTYFFEHVADPDASERWVLFEASSLYEALGAAYIDRLTTEVPDLSDAEVNGAATPVWSAIRDGSLTIADASVAAFLAEINGRDGLQLLESAITGDPVSGGIQAWTTGVVYVAGDEVSHNGLDRSPIAVDVGGVLQLAKEFLRLFPVGIGDGFHVSHAPFG